MNLPRTLAVMAVLGVAAACGSSSSDNTTGTDGTDAGGGSGSDSGGGGGGGTDSGGGQPGADGGGSGKDGGGSTSNDYGTDGPSMVTSKAEKASNGKTTFDVTVYLPSGKGPFPVVVLSSGFLQTAPGYAPYAKRLASWGIATILRDDPVGGQATTVQTDVEGEVTSWLPTADGNIYDATRVGLAGHSRGGQVSLLAAENGLLGKVKGLFLLDPVDNSSSSVKPKIATLGVPLAMLGETTDSGGMDCAPAADNFASMYGMAAAPALSITIPNADHVMFEDPNACTLCGLCTKGTADASKVLALSQRLMTTFFAKVLLGDATIDATLNTTADVTAGTITVDSK